MLGATMATNHAALTLAAGVLVDRRGSGVPVDP
jgi:hypothetical protein